MRAAWVPLLVLAVTASASAQDGFGGSRSNGLVREQVRAGLVPRPDAFTVEGFLAEHHFPVRQARCAERFCVLTAMGHGLHRPTLERSAYLLVEPVSGIDPERYERAPVNLTLVIDQSGSMAGWKLATALAAAHRVVDRLGPDDLLSIVSFHSEPRVLRPPRPVRDRQELHRLVDAIAVEGGTNLHAGLSTGFEQTRAASSAARTDHVFLLTDEQPNVGVTDAGSFQELVGTFAARRVGLTVVGVGLDLGAELAHLMSRLEGGSYHYLARSVDAEALVTDRFDTLITPVAYRATVRIDPGPGLRVAGVYGVPGDDVVVDREGGATLRASTVFLDRRRGGAVVRLEPVDAAPLGELSARVSFSWVDPRTGGTHRGGHEAIHRPVAPRAAAEFEDPHHYRAYALVNFAQLLRASLHHYHLGDRGEALRILANARRALDIDARVTDDPELAAERALADGLLRQMRPLDRFVVM